MKHEPVALTNPATNDSPQGSEDLPLTPGLHSPLTAIIVAVLQIEMFYKYDWKRKYTYTWVFEVVWQKMVDSTLVLSQTIKINFHAFHINCNAN